jgi:transposase-like protein
MDPREQFCHNSACPARGKVGEGNIRVFSHKEQRYQCTMCNQTFVASKGTAFYRLRTADEDVVLVLTLLAHGCPVQAIVAALGYDERTIASWQARAGEHCEDVHEHLVEQGQVDLQHVQADELWVKVVARKLWMAMAIAVPTRLWLGGVISAQRDMALIMRLVQKVRACGRSLNVLVCVDGLPSYVTAFLRVFRNPLRTGQPGRPRLLVAEGLLIGQVIKQYAQRHVVSVERRIKRGTAEAIAAVLATTHTGTQINTAYVERLNATFRSRLATLVRRGRAIARWGRVALAMASDYAAPRDTVLTAGMYLVGCAYNFCWYHDSLRVAAPEGDHPNNDNNPSWRWRRDHSRLWRYRSPDMPTEK